MSYRTVVVTVTNKQKLTFHLKETDTTATFYEQVKTRLPKLMESGFKLNTGVQEIQYSHSLTVTFEDHYITVPTKDGN